MAKTPQKPLWIIGIDEVGRGPLAGPVYLCAIAMRVVQYRKARWHGLTDSKKMTALARARWYAKAKEMEGAGNIKISLAQKSARDIDAKGVAVCISMCITDALKDLSLRPKDCLVLLDGALHAPGAYQNQKTIIRGDQKKKIISLASVVAKVSRDAYMQRLGKKYPQYGWGINKGYGTKTHREAIRAHGIVSLHRKSFLSRILDKKA